MAHVESAPGQTRLLAFGVEVLCLWGNVRTTRSSFVLSRPFGLFFLLLVLFACFVVSVLRFPAILRTTYGSFAARVGSGSDAGAPGLVLSPIRLGVRGGLMSMSSIVLGWMLNQVWT